MARLSIEPRTAPSRLMQVSAPLIAVALTMATGTVLFAALGRDPATSLYHYFVFPLLSVYSLTELVLKATPLMLIGTGLAIGFRANVWNIGAEGQLILGAICGSVVALAFWGEAGVHVLPLMALAGIVGGMAWAAIPALLRTRFGVNEILTSLMLTYVASLFLNLLVHGPMRDPEGFNFPQSRLFTDSALLPILFESTRLHVATLLAPLICVAAWLMMERALFGFQVKVTGQAPRAARFAGFNADRIVFACLLLSGGLAGLAGVLEVAGPIGQLVPNVSPGYGFTAIIVAFLGRLHPLAIILAALLIALTYLGGESAQISAGLPQAVTGVFQGMLLFFLLASDILVRYRVRLRGPAAAPVQVQEA